MMLQRLRENWLIDFINDILIELREIIVLFEALLENIMKVLNLDQLGPFPLFSQEKNIVPP
jgi:hypothetical protein